jgi:hypothetical protein
MKWKVLCITLFFLFFFFSKFSYAQESDDEKATASAEQESTYQLPFPGILPGNPFYFFKPLRDHIVGFLITDPVKKTQFDLLMADKRLSAGQALMSRGQTQLAESTLSKGENYFSEAIVSAQEAKKQGFVIDGIGGQLEASSEKHEQEIVSMQEKDTSSYLNQILARVRGFEKQSSQMMSQK